MFSTVEHLNQLVFLPTWQRGHNQIAGVISSSRAFRDGVVPKITAGQSAKKAKGKRRRRKRGRRRKKMLPSLDTADDLRKHTKDHTILMVCSRHPVHSIYGIFDRAEHESRILASCCSKRFSALLDPYRHPIQHHAGLRACLTAVM